MQPRSRAPEAVAWQYREASESCWSASCPHGHGASGGGSPRDVVVIGFLPAERLIYSESIAPWPHAKQRISHEPIIATDRRTGFPRRPWPGCPLPTRAPGPIGLASSSVSTPTLYKNSKTSKIFLEFKSRRRFAPLDASGTTRARQFTRDAGGRSTIATPLPARYWRRRGGRFPRSAPWRAGSATDQSRPPSRRSGRLQGSRGGPAGAGSPGSRLTAARLAPGRLGAHIAAPSRSGLRPPRLGPCSGRGSWQPSSARWECRARPGGSVTSQPPDHLGGNRQREYGPSLEPINQARVPGTGPGARNVSLRQD
jgi:hypothetical protein